MKEFWGIRRGGNHGNQYVQTGKISEVAKVIKAPLPLEENGKTLSNLALKVLPDYTVFRGRGR